MMTIKLYATIRRAAVLGLLALCSFASTKPASAQVAISGNYYEEYKVAGCTTATNVCMLIFSATPQQVFFTDVSCWLQSSQPINQTYFAVADSVAPTTPRRREFFPIQAMPFGAYAAKFKTSFLIGNGRYPAVSLSMGDTGTAVIECKIVGTFEVP